MSVFIRGATMPKTCNECIQCSMRNAIKCCEWSNISAQARSSRRSLWCPLVEVKAPHGDLIDQDTVPYNTQYAPVVIKAEG